jgi:hypothetical protein
MLAVARWLLVPIVAVVGCWLGFALAIALHSLATRLCPTELLVSGLCTASWFPVAEAASLSFGSAVGATLVVLLPSQLAPAYQRVVGVVAFGFGAIYAASFAVLVGSSTLLYAACALAAGAATLRRVWVLAASRALTPPSSGQPQATLESAAHVERYAPA